MATPADPTPTLPRVTLEGGVGETAPAVDFAACRGLRGVRTSPVDSGPQTNATFGRMTCEHRTGHAATRGTVADSLGVVRYAAADGTSEPVESVALKGVFDAVGPIPSRHDLFAADLGTAGETARETRPKRAAKPVAGNCDAIVRDGPPNSTIPTRSPLAASTRYAVPGSPGVLPGIRIGLLRTRVKKLGEDLEVPPNSAGVVASRVGRTAEFREASAAAARGQFGGRVPTPEIKGRVAVASGTARSKRAFACGDGDAAAEFRSVCGGRLARAGGT